MAALAVYRRPGYLGIALVAFLIMSVLLLWSSETLIFGQDGVHVLIEPLTVGVALCIAVLFALLLPMQIYAYRLAAASARHAGGTAAGALLGTASMTCCTPVLLPSLLSVLGFSGTTILNLNLALHRWWLPLATVSVLFLAYSLVAAAQALDAKCRVPSAR